MTESHGICLFRKNKKEIDLLMIKRRCTYSFYFIACGDFRLTNLRSLLAETTYSEKIVLLERNFEYVYFTAFGFSPLRLEKESYARYKKAEERFLHIFTPEYISRELFGMPSVDLIWEFPKGRLKPVGQDSSLECAKREFQEETGIRDYNIRNIPPVTFEFQDGGKTFKYTLYIADAPNLEINQFRKHSYSECTESAWISPHHSKLLLNCHMLKLYKKINNHIKKICKQNYAEIIRY